MGGCLAANRHYDARIHSRWVVCAVCCSRRANTGAHGAGQADRHRQRGGLPTRCCCASGLSCGMGAWNGCCCCCCCCWLWRYDYSRRQLSSTCGLGELLGRSHSPQITHQPWRQHTPQQRKRWCILVCPGCNQLLANSRLVPCNQHPHSAQMCYDNDRCARQVWWWAGRMMGGEWEDIEDSERVATWR